MDYQGPYTFPALFERTLNNHPDANAMSFVSGEPFSYKELKSRIDSLMAFMEKLNIRPGDKIAILSANKPNWGIAYYAISFMGAVAVPLLPDFHPDEIQNIINRSDTSAIFVTEALYPKIQECDCSSLKNIIMIDDFSTFKTTDPGIQYQANQKPAVDYKVDEDDLAAIIYTSGTSGKSKGVMLTHKNISLNAVEGFKVQNIDTSDRFLSILPLSHTYENTLGLILPMLGGACVYYLKKLPTASVLLPALKKIRPTIMLSVPLIIEKIYRTKILLTFSKNAFIRFLYSIPAVRKKLNALAGKKLMETFGGEMRFFGIGGNKLDSVVEKFLIEAKFPYAIGYGLTETSPLLAGVNPKNVRHESTGPVVEAMELKINNPDPVTGEGEVWAKGPCIMKGYYKEPELTSQVLTKDGWFKTGDLATMDAEGFVYIKGRLKNMIVGASGENIYPEEIESVINNFHYVLESLVIENKGKLVAMVHFNREALEEKYNDLKDEVTQYIDKKIDELKEELHDYVNQRVNKFSRVQMIKVQPEPFQKTATQKIKRFLYV